MTHYSSSSYFIIFIIVFDLTLRTYKTQYKILNERQVNMNLKLITDN
jgi:hypothetical protein